MSTPQTFTFHAADGTPLAGTLYPGAAPDPAPDQAPVLMAGALAVPQRFYAAFCTWLAAQGPNVMSFDPRGMAASRQPQHQRSLRGLQADMLTWARQDFAAAVLHLSGLHHGAAIHVIGHSLGLHHAAMTGAAAQQRISRVVAVASGAGHWRTWAEPSRRLAPLMFRMAGPLATPLFGYFPGQRLRMVGDLPAGVMRQWSRWCSHPAFAWGAEPEQVLPSLQAARFAITAFSFTDDEAMTEGCTRVLLAALPHAPSQRVRLSPADVGLQRIGHLGAFKPAAAALWPRLKP